MDGWCKKLIATGQSDISTCSTGIIKLVNMDWKKVITKQCVCRLKEMMHIVNKTFIAF